MKLSIHLIFVVTLVWTTSTVWANPENKPGLRFYKRLPLKKKEEIKIVDDFTVEVSLGADGKWVSSNIVDALRSIPIVKKQEMPKEALFRGKPIYRQRSGKYTWNRNGKSPVKLTSKDIRKNGNIIIQLFEKQSVETKLKPKEDSDSYKASIKGFRSAEFGMAQEEVLGAILKDFGIRAQEVTKGRNIPEKTDHLIVKVPDLIPGTGSATVIYIFGYQSDKLNQVNLFWGKPFDPDPNPSAIIKVARDLKGYFSKREFIEDSIQTNVPLTNEILLVFKGADSDGRMVELILNDPEVKEGSGQAGQSDLALRLSYIEKPSNLDIYQIESGDF